MNLLIEDTEQKSKINSKQSTNQINEDKKHIFIDEKEILEKISENKLKNCEKSDLFQNNYLKNGFSSSKNNKNQKNFDKNNSKNTKYDDIIHSNNQKTNEDY